MTDRENAVFASLERSAIVAVLIIERLDDAVPVAQALQLGGVDAMELTLRTPVAIAALRRIRAQVPGMPPIGITRRNKPFAAGLAASW